MSNQATLANEHVGNVLLLRQARHQNMSPSSKMERIGEQSKKWLSTTFLLPREFDLDSIELETLQFTYQGNAGETFAKLAALMNSVYIEHPNTLVHEGILNHIERMLSTGPVPWSHMEIQPLHISRSLPGSTVLLNNPTLSRNVHCSMGMQRFLVQVHYWDQDRPGVVSEEAPTSTLFFLDSPNGYERISVKTMASMAESWTRKHAATNSEYLISVHQVKLLGSREPESFGYVRNGRTFDLTFRTVPYATGLALDPHGAMPQKLTNDILAEGTSSMLFPEHINNIINIHRSMKRIESEVLQTIQV